MSALRDIRLWAVLALLLGVAGCILGARGNFSGLLAAWLATCIFWLGVPLGAVTLLLVQDLTGGRWMGGARPALEAAAIAMPLATLAFLPLVASLPAIYRWSAGESGLTNHFYLNDGFFALRYAVDVVLWNALAAWAVLAPRAGAEGVPRGLSWVSALGLVLLAFTAAFATIDWLMSLDPRFWSAVMPMFVSAGWFNTGLALVLLTLALGGTLRRDDLADLAAILLATSIFWAYTEFSQFLIIWEENLKSEIVWYLPRIAGAWAAIAALIAMGGFFLPFFVLIWRPSKRSRAVVAVIAAAILASRVLDAWWMVLPGLPGRAFGWLDIAAFVALGGAVVLLFHHRLRHGRLLPARAAPALETRHG